MVKDLEGEIWYKIEGSPYYMVSNLFRVKSLARIVPALKSSYKPLKEKIINGTITRHGYITMDIEIFGKRKKKLLHRLVADILLPNPDNLPFINHIDGNKLNNHLSNFEWCTQRDNMLHAHRTGLCSQKGEDNPFCKLSDDQVQSIRSDYKNGLGSQASLGRKYGVAQTHIGKIVNNQSRVINGE